MISGLKSVTAETAEIISEMKPEMQKKSEIMLRFATEISAREVRAKTQRKHLMVYPSLHPYVYNISHLPHFSPNCRNAIAFGSGLPERERWTPLLNVQ